LGLRQIKVMSEKRVPVRLNNASAEDLPMLELTSIKAGQSEGN
jgi:hypothetical protein